MKIKHILAALVLGITTLSTTAFAKSAPTQQVWEEHIAAWGRADLDGIAAHYTDDSLLIVNNFKFKGKKKIRGVFNYLFKRFDQGSNVIDPAIVDGPIIYIAWNFTPAEQKEAIYGMDTFVVENGVIKYQTIASALYRKPVLELLGGVEQK